MPATEDPLLLLRQCAKSKLQPKLLAENEESVSVDHIQQARRILFPKTSADDQDSILELDRETRFVRKEPRTAFTIATILFAWYYRDKGIGDYITACGEVGLTNLSFVERGDLFAWLEGANTSEFIESDAATGIETSDKVLDVAKRSEAGKPGGPRKSDLLRKIHAQERTLSHRKTVLHGLKSIDFTSVHKDANDIFISKLRKRERDGERKAQLEKQQQQQMQQSSKKPKHSHPIIILSPSPSSLITMHNVKAFLEEGVFIPPEEAARNAGGGSGAEMLQVTRKSERMGTDRGARFMIVEGVDKFKPDYWERVVCVVTTGQAWQFNSYKWSTPQELFQHVRGVLIQYQGEVLPSSAKTWNVVPIRIERGKRHRDKEVVEGFWEGLEKWMEGRGRIQRR